MHIKYIFKIINNLNGYPHSKSTLHQETKQDYSENRKYQFALYFVDYRLEKHYL